MTTASDNAPLPDIREQRDKLLTAQFASALSPRFIKRPVLMATAEIAGAGIARAGVAGADESPERSPFVLSLSEWIDLQVGMANLDRIALTMRNIGADLAAPANEAERLAKLWRDTAFPALRSAATDIRDYGHQIAIEIPRSTTRDQLRALFHTLTTAAGAAETRAAAAYAHIVELEGASATLRANVAALRKVYLSRAESATAETKRLRTELDELSKKMPERQAQYHHYVTVAATTVTYAWIPFFGWIAGGAVAGTYGRAAVVEKEGIDRDAGRIAEITQTLTKQEHQIAILTRATNGLESMGGSFARVLPVIQHTQGIWGAIKSDLAALFKLLEDASDTSEFAAMLGLELQVAASGWKDVADKAADYLRHAEVAAAPDPAPFGNFRTQVRYNDKTFDENHVLTIDLLGVAVNGIPVSSPIFETRRLHWGWQTDANRHNKPETADIQFTADAFEGRCNFPMEGQIGWIGTRI